MASAGLMQEVERILEALPESATLRDLLYALESDIEPTEPHAPHSGADPRSEAEPDEARSALGIRDTCAARRRRSADRD